MSSPEAKLIPMSVETRICMAMQWPIILKHMNPKSDRLVYITYLRKHKLLDKVTVVWRPDSGRVILGPKDFQIQIFLNLDECSQDALNQAWENRIAGIELADGNDGLTFPNPNSKSKSKTNASEALEQFKLDQEIKKMDKTSEDALKTIGFGNVSLETLFKKDSKE